MTETAFGLDASGEARVRVICEAPGTAAWLLEMVTPWFEVVGPRPDQATVRVHESPRSEAAPEGKPSVEPCFAMDRTVESASARRTATTVLVDHDAGGATYDIGPTGVDVRPSGSRPQGRLGAFRVIRELLVAQVPDGTAVQLHASALTSGGHVIVMAGPKRSGKTTTLAHLVASVGAGLVANDRVLVRRERESWIARGVPTIVSLRAGTVAALPELHATVPGRGRTIHLTIEEAERASAASRALHPGRDPAMSQAQLAQLLQAPLAAGGAVGCIALLGVDEGVDAFAVRPLSASAAGPRLDECRFGATTEPRASTVFECWLERPRSPGRTRLVEALAAGVPCAEVRVGPGLLASREAATELLGTLATLA